MRATETAIRDRLRRWWGQFRAWKARLDEQQHQRACYSLISVQRASAVAKWLAGMSGAGTVLAFAFYIQSYLSILSIKNDCVSRRFVADANGAAVWIAGFFLVSGMLALLAHRLAGTGRHWAEPSTLDESPQTAAATAGT
jgi:hypothetical protein